MSAGTSCWITPPPPLSLFEELEIKPRHGSTTVSEDDDSEFHKWLSQRSN